MKRKISFIILNYNDADTTMKLADSLESWKCQKFNLNVVVVDNRSTDSSFTVLKNKYKNAIFTKVIQSEKNGGYSYGNNYGIKFAIMEYNPDYIAIANPDIIIDEETVEKLLDSFEKLPDIVMVAPVEKNLKGEGSVKTQRLPLFKDDLLACFNSNMSSTISKNELEYYDDAKTMLKTELIVGCFFVIKTEIIQKVDYLDENTFLFCEERILGKKLKDNHMKMAVRADLEFIHAHSVSIKKTYDIINTWKLIMKSRLYYEKEYNQCTRLKVSVLKLAMNMFIMLLIIKLQLHRLKRWIIRGE